VSWFSKKAYRVVLKNLNSTIVYEEGDRRMEIDAEPASGGYDVIVYGSTMKWSPPHEALPLTAAERDGIRRNIETGLRGLRLAWED
jgi:Immunity protein 74